MDIESNKFSEIANQISSLLAVSFSVCICAVGIYEIAFFDTLRLSVRSVPIGIVDFTLEIIRILPVGLALTLVYILMDCEFKSLKRREDYFIQLKKLNLKDIRKIKRLRQFKFRKHKYRLLFIIFLMVSSLFFNIIGGTWFPNLILPAILILIFSSCIYIICVWFAHFLRYSKFSYIFMILGGVAVILSWGAVSAVIALDNADHANLVINTQEIEEVPVRVIGTYDKGILIMNQGKIEFLFWDLVKRLDYGAPDRVKIMEGFVCGAKGPRNCLSDNQVSQSPK